MKYRREASAQAMAVACSAPRLDGGNLQDNLYNPDAAHDGSLNSSISVERCSATSGSCALHMVLIPDER